MVIIILRSSGNTSIDYKETSRYIVLRQSLASLADNFSAPYIGYYLASLTPSGTTQGVLQFSINALPTLAQILVGPIIDRFRRYILTLLISSTIASVMWLIISVTTKPLLLTLLVTARAIFVGIAGLSFTAFIGVLFTGIERGVILSRVNVVSQLTALVAFALTALVINPSIDVLKVFFIFSGTVSLLASILWLRLLHIDHRLNNGKREKEVNLISALKIVKRNRSFIKLSVAYSSHVMSMALAWPWFPLVQKYVLNMSVAEIAMLNIYGTFSTMIAQYVFTRYIHRVSLKKLLIVSRIGFIIPPLFYSQARDPILLYISSLLLGPFSALSNVAIPLYTLKISTHNMYASYIALLNFSQGILAALGSIIGGTIADIVIGNQNYDNLRYALLVDTGLRMTTSLLFTKIDEV